ncbi:MAG: hypothetical protein JO292_02345, partial [Betaproteobacteria bacterium]|nr:hypothetical protein [Betaproteobacteria bacterium]
MAGKIARRVYDGLKSLLALVGVVSIATLLALPLARGDLSNFANEALFEPTTIVAGPIQAQVDTPLEREQRVVTEYIAKRYR